MRPSLRHGTLFVSEWTIINLKNISWLHIKNKILAQVEGPPLLQQSSLININVWIIENSGSKTFFLHI